MFKRKPMPDVGPPATPEAKELHDLSYDELATQKILIDQELARRGAHEFEALKAKLVAAAAALGVSMQDLFAGKKPEKKRREAPIKHRNPDNPGGTRTGVGKPKTQLQAKLDEGRDLEEVEAS